MTKAALREKRRAERIARRNRTRIIAGVIGILILAVLVFLVLNEQLSTPSVADEIGGPYTLSDKAVTTSTGLIYEDLTVGVGPALQSGDTASVFYTGYLTDGTEFDSNVASGTPFDVPVGQGAVIPGWDEGLVGMQVGGERLLVIPSSLAYGPTGYSSIPGNATLTFSVTLVEIK